MISNSITSSSSKTNLSFFKKRLNVTQPPPPTLSKEIDQQPPLEINIPPTTSQKQTEKQLTLNFEIRIKGLENDIEQDNITMEKIKELLELYAVKFLTKFSFKFIKEAVEYYESINDERYLKYKQKMLILLNKPNVISIFNKTKENNKKITQNGICDQNLNNDFRRKHPIKAKTEEMLNKHEEALLQKKDIINKNLKSQMDAIKFRLESRKFSKNHIKNPTISKKNSLFLGISSFSILSLKLFK